MDAKHNIAQACSWVECGTHIDAATERRCDAMKIDGAKLTEDGVLLITSDFTARRFVYDFKPGEYEITKAKQKRSLNANSYAWQLIGQIGNALRESKEDIYFDMLKSYGQGGTVSIEERFVENFKRTYKYHESLGKSELKGKTFEHFRFWVGSSEYNTEEMSILIDGIVQEAKQLDIETLTPIELARLKDEWP